MQYIVVNRLDMDNESAGKDMYSMAGKILGSRKTERKRMAGRMNLVRARRAFFLKYGAP